MLKKIICLLTMLMLCLAAVAAGAEGEYRLLRKGNIGDDVETMKKRLYDLGYYTTTKLNGNFNDGAVEVLRNFQKMNNLLMTGDADPYTQAVMFSDAAVRADGTAVNAQAGLPPEGAGGDGQFRALSEGCYGDDVLAVKKAFHGLGLYKSTDFNNVFNGAMTERVLTYQAENGFAADGVLTPEQLLALLGPQNVTGIAAPTVEVAFPPLDAEGYLADAAAEPFVVSDFDQGVWYYIDQELRIEILRYQDLRADLSWYETDIRCKPTVQWNAIMSQGSREEGHNFVDGMTIADSGRAILAVTDDNFGYRWYQRNIKKNTKYQQGVIIRNGIVRADAMPDDSYYDFPPLDVMAYYPDGRVELYYPEEHNAQDYLDMGVMHTYAFGPILLRGGQVNERLYAPGSKTLEAEYEEHAARQAIGYYEPGHYLIITANGNHDLRTGVVMQWMVNKMIEKGVSDAFNLDGGRTTLLYFMGQAVNKKENVNRDAMRDVTGVLGIGTLK